MAENRKAEIEEVIKVTALAGAGVESSVYREVHQYWTKEGKLIGIMDPVDKDQKSMNLLMLRNEELERQQHKLVQENHSLVHHIEILENIIKESEKETDNVPELETTCKPHTDNPFMKCIHEEGTNENTA